MKSLFMLLLVYNVLQAQSLFVSTLGNDKNLGNKNSPLKTLKIALEHAVAGDTIYLREGSYGLGIYINKSGKKNNPITIKAYKNEKVLFQGDKSHQNNDFRIRGNWIVLKDIEIKHSYNGLLLEKGASHNIIQNVLSHHNHFSGFVITRGAAHNTIIDCSAYDNFDKGGSMGEGGNADGFGTGSRIGNDQYIGPGNQFINCKSWHNSDDGFDFWKSGNPVTVINCHAYNNGYAEGDGNGFKLGPHNPKHRNDHHIIRDSKAWNNKQNGFDFNMNEDSITLENNIAYNNLVNYKFLGNAPHIFRNNKSISSKQTNKLSTFIIDINNSWDSQEKFPLSKQITIQTQCPTIDVNQNIIVSITGMPGNDRDWVAVYPVGANSTFANIISYKFTKGIRSGEIDLGTLPAGNYEARAFYANSWMVRAREYFTVINDNDNKDSKIFLIGDSTVHNNAHGEMGWGSALKNLLKNPNRAFNQARSGASSSTFKNIDMENHHDWVHTKELMQEDNHEGLTYLFIQFGHNDNPKSDEEFYQSLKSYVLEAKELHVIPILITPISRLYKNDFSHKGYPDVVRKLVEDENIILLDLQHKSFVEFNKYETDKAVADAFAHDDHTHFSPQGALIVANWVKELACQVSPVLCIEF